MLSRCRPKCRLEAQLCPCVTAYEEHDLRKPSVLLQNNSRHGSNSNITSTALQTSESQEQRLTYIKHLHITGAHTRLLCTQTHTHALIHMLAHARVYTSIHGHTYIYIHTHKHTYTYTHASIHTPTHLYTCLRTHEHTQACMDIYVYTTHIHIYTHTCIYTHMHTGAHAHVCTIKTE